jgi:phage baseplate assembly protein W
MIRPTYSAWRFLHPDFDRERPEKGIVVNNTGGIDRVEGAQSVRQSVLLLLTTRPGERVMRPSYGCDLFRLLFSPNDATTQGLAIHYVRTALLKYEPRIEILRLDANANREDVSVMDITLEYRVMRTHDVDAITLPFNLMHEGI